MPHSPLTRLMILVLLCLGVVAPGCGKRHKAKLFPVEGRVIKDGQPLAGAVVIFHAEEATTSGEPSPTPQARTDENGHFRLGTITANDGAPAGSYKVVVISYKMSKRNDRYGEDCEGDRLEGRYGTRDVTPLTATVRAGQNDELEFIVQ